MKADLKITEAQIVGWPALAAHRDELEPCIDRRDGATIYVDGNGECWKTIRSKYVAPVQANATVAEAPKDGPGTELHEILLKLGIDMVKDCGCEWKIEQMNRWGVDGCLENFERIVGWMVDGAKEYGWDARATAGFHALRKRIILNPLNPFPKLVRMAIDGYAARAGSE